MSTEMQNSKGPTLVILAAGIGSRYGGLKQLDTFSPQGDTIIDFSIYDAIEAGFKKIVFIIRENLLEEFKEVFEPKLKGKAEVDYVFQELDRVPDAFVDSNRTKPWGTGHALLLTKDVVKENFAIINADDFYGRESFIIMANALNDIDSDSYHFNMVAFQLKNTVSDHGYVSRGECKVSQDGYLEDVTERTHIEKQGDKILVENESGDLELIDPETFVSMNFWGFTPKCFEFGWELFNEFLERSKGNIKAEFFIPTVVNEMLQSDKVSVEVLSTPEKWFGVTYKEDKAIAQTEIKKLKDNAVYPVHLWD
ncbi:sugar phosphate nucleotidyltransferase [Leeuwenhoekiella palythoae]|uniref:Nucleotidyl transferase n=1 Tax=Leeuwenhoekiella palythoae TaxID=573501 RepID=A0A1M5SD15_9FLAO|nr:sugar phosphate nucleotidyltransferase [Leeuwenhoekiella palythoae]RXG28997.1 nucleotidyltransferase-like protein [Leeuwenhoekiella palythoae]SHH36361.1 Nucleotidyl transferase [Leeuwenhoekiella palythoae]